MSKTKLSIPNFSRTGLSPDDPHYSPSDTIIQWVAANLGLNMSYDEDKRAEIKKWGYPWFRAGAVVFNDDGKILMMHEGRVQVKKIKDAAVRNFHLERGLTKSSWVCGDGGWNLPSGRLRSYQDGPEYFDYAAVREVYEESGWNVEILSLLHIRHSEKPDNQYIMPVFLAKATKGPESYHAEETMEIDWFSPEEIRTMHAADMLRSPEFVMDSLDAYEKSLHPQN